MLQNLFVGQRPESVCLKNTGDYGVTIPKTPLYGYGCPELNENTPQGSGYENEVCVYINAALRNLSKRQSQLSSECRNVPS